MTISCPTVSRVDTCADALAAALAALLDEEERFARTARALGDAPDLADLDRARRDLGLARDAAARAWVVALRLGGTWTLRVDADQIVLDHTRPPDASTDGGDPAAPPSVADPPPPLEAAPTRVPATPTARPADPASLEALQATFGAGRTWSPAAAPVVPLLGTPRPVPLPTLADRLWWLSWVERAADGCPDWTAAPRDTQRAALALVVTVARHVQDGCGVDASLHARFDGVFAKLGTFSAFERPGFVHGLAQKHQPQRGTWLEDARAAWDALLGGTAPDPRDAVRRAIAEGVDAAALRAVVLEALGAGVEPGELVDVVSARRADLAAAREPGLRELRKRLKRLARDAATEARAPTAEPLRARTAGWRVLVVGGDALGQTTGRWKAAFGFASVDWEQGRGPRGVGRQTERIRAGSYDLVVLVTAFVAHDVSVPVVDACRAGGVRFVPLGMGYGTEQLRHGLARLLAEKPAA